MTKQEVAKINALIGENIHREIWRRKLPQRVVADALGITATGVSRRLRGHAGIEVGELLIIARLLDVPMMSLLYPQQEYLTVPIEEHNAAMAASKEAATAKYAIADSNREPAD